MLMMAPISTGYFMPAIITTLVSIVLIGAIALLWGLSPLLSPAPLSAASNGVPLKGYLSHAEFENDCLFCHSPWRGSSDKRCLTCHTAISLEVRSQTELHGRLGSASPCSQCHPEHQGRQAEIANVSLETYPHDQTRFKLSGSHSDIACADCHPDNHYRLTAVTCQSCHPEPDVHAGKYGADCERCHAMPHDDGFLAVAWTPVTLDHAIFPLADGHASANCEQCHPTPQFQQTVRECAACHAEPASHLGWYGTACNNCHTTLAWTPSTFDHNRLALPLAGKHAAIECLACHTSQPFTGMPSACNDCHSAPAFHQTSQFGVRCQMCHADTGWQPAFLRQHPFPIEHGNPQQTASECQTCHPQNYTTYSCILCHAGEQVTPDLLMN